MVRLGACSKDVTPLVTLDKGTVDCTIYIKKVLPIALKYGRKFLVTTGSFNRLVLGIIEQNNGVNRFLHHLSTRIDGLQIVSI